MLRVTQTPSAASRSCAGSLLLAFTITQTSSQVVFGGPNVTLPSSSGKAASFPTGRRYTIGPAPYAVQYSLLSDDDGRSWGAMQLN